MALLSQAAAQEVNDWLARRCPNPNLTKPDLRAASAAADSWADANAASFNAALPAKAQSNLSTKEKTLLLAIVILERAGFSLAALLGPGI